MMIPNVVGHVQKLTEL